jgi:hypothetical protein
LLDTEGVLDDPHPALTSTTATALRTAAIPRSTSADYTTAENASEAREKIAAVNVASVFAILGGAGAVVSAAAAAMSARSAASVYRPFVHVTSMSSSSATPQVDVTVTNSGPGTATHVQCRVAGSGWSRPLASLASGAGQGVGVTQPALQSNVGGMEGAAETSRNMEQAIIEVAFSAMDGSRWRTISRGSNGRPSMQRLTPRAVYFWRKL